MRYRDCEIGYNPVAPKHLEFTWAHDDYDGPEDQYRHGVGASVEVCKEQIDEMYVTGVVKS